MIRVFSFFIEYGIQGLKKDSKSFLLKNMNRVSVDPCYSKLHTASVYKIMSDGFTVLKIVFSCFE